MEQSVIKTRPSGVSKAKKEMEKREEKADQAKERAAKKVASCGGGPIFDGTPPRGTWRVASQMPTLIVSPARFALVHALSPFHKDFDKVQPADCSTPVN